MNGPDRLLLRLIALAALVVGGVVATARTHASWMLVLTVVGLVAAAGVMARCAQALLSEDDRPAPARARRVPVAAFGAVAAFAVVLAVALPVEDSVAVSTKTPSARAAAETVRAFLADAVLDGDGYAACQYLTAGAQQQVARMASDDQTCRGALTSTDPSFAGVHSEGSLRALRLDAVARDATAYVSARRRGRPTVTFVLRPATGAEAAAFEAPSAAWRIASGATAVLAPVLLNGGVS